MRVTDIKRQQKAAGRFSVYLDGAYAFSLDEHDLLATGLVIGREVTPAELDGFKKMSHLGKLFARSLNYLAIRMRSEDEMRQYLRRKDASPEESQQLIERLYQFHYLDDQAFARSWVEQRRALKKRSNRVLRLELRQKGINSELINEVLSDSDDAEKQALRELVIKKRRMSRYKENDKLLAYLVRQGYNYSLVIEVLAEG